MKTLSKQELENLIYTGVDFLKTDPPEEIYLDTLENISAAVTTLYRKVENEEE